MSDNPVLHCLLPLFSGLNSGRVGTPDQRTGPNLFFFRIRFYRGDRLSRHAGNDFQRNNAFVLINSHKYTLVAVFFLGFEPIHTNSGLVLIAFTEIMEHRPKSQIPLEVFCSFPVVFHLPSSSGSPIKAFPPPVRRCLEHYPVRLPPIGNTLPACRSSFRLHRGGLGMVDPSHGISNAPMVIIRLDACQGCLNTTLADRLQIENKVIEIRNGLILL